MSPMRLAAVALTAAASLAVPAHADAPPPWCHMFGLTWPYGATVVLDTAGVIGANEIDYASCGVTAVPLVGAGSTAIAVDGGACILTVTTQAYVSTYYGTYKPYASPTVIALAETRCTTPVDLTQRIDALLDGTVVGSAAGAPASGTTLTGMSALLTMNGATHREARYCVAIAAAESCVTSTPI